MAYLTKSRFKLGLECPTKLYYDSFRNRYNNEKTDDPFLEALAKGGFQVGELAKLYYPGGIDIDTLDEAEAIRRTEEALENDEVVIFEAAIKVGHKFIRVDILHKTPNQIRVIEVKSKGGEGSDPQQFFNTTGIVPAWRPYIEDVAFQTYVVEAYFRDRPDRKPVKPYLMLADKTSTASIDGLHQNFVLKTDERGRHYCEPREGITIKDLGDKILTETEVSDVVNAVINDQYYHDNNWEVKGFIPVISWFEQLLIGYENNEPAWHNDVGFHCRGCQYKTEGNESLNGKVSGFRECFETKKNWTIEQLNAYKTWDVWDLRSARSIIEEGRWFLSELTEDDVATANEVYEDPIEGEGLTRVQRQWTQIDRMNNEGELFIDKENLRDELSEYNYPLHFIDFETLAPAIPFYSGYRPYQGIGFQYSHHIVREDGSMEHIGEYLGQGQGTNPFAGFIEGLYNELSQDEGTIFMYSSHENTYINYVIHLLMDNSPFDAVATQTYIDFFMSVSRPSSSSRARGLVWPEPERMMVDLRTVVLRNFWHPIMGKSNSIKQVLPAVLNSSPELQRKYSQPLYGSEEFRSLNFSPRTWIEYNDDGSVKDPYKLLPTLEEIFEVPLNDIDVMFADEKIGNGGAAMTAWAYMQFTEMSQEERDAITRALKCYCELDTLAMVFIWEYFNQVIAD